jgi:hypothetical protein
VNAVRQLLLGETWILPGGLALLLLASGLLLNPLLGDTWEDAGGAVLVVGVLGLLVAAVRRSA